MGKFHLMVKAPEDDVPLITGDHKDNACEDNAGTKENIRQALILKINFSVWRLHPKSRFLDSHGWSLGIVSYFLSAVDTFSFQSHMGSFIQMLERVALGHDGC